MPPPDPLASCTVLLAYDEAVRDLITAIKYRGRRAQLGWLAQGLAGVLEPLVAGGGRTVDVVTWAPTAASRRRRRGFDQAESAARAVARHLGLPARRLLIRGPGPPQTGRTSAQRRHGPRFALAAPVDHLGVLVVDDVLTTGATLAAAGRTLRDGGCRAVHGAALAHPR